MYVPIPKRQKNEKKFLKTHTHPSKKKSFSFQAVSRRMGIIPKHSKYLKNYIFV